mgnify:CR=1 FL=1
MRASQSPGWLPDVSRLVNAEAVGCRPIGVGLSGRFAPGVGLQHKRVTYSARLKSASPGAARRASAYADAGRSAQAD